MRSAETGKVIRSFSLHEAFYMGGAYLPDGRILAGTKDGMVKLFHVEEGEKVIPMRHAYTIRAIAHNARNNLVATASFDYTAKLWSDHTWDLRGIFRHEGFVEDVDISFDGDMLVTASVDRSVTPKLKSPSVARMTRLTAFGWKRWRATAYACMMPPAPFVWPPA